MENRRATRAVNIHRGAMCAALLCALVLATVPGTAFGQLTSPLAHNKQLQSGEYPSSKFRDRKADKDKEGDIQHNGTTRHTRCGRHRLDLRWMSEATSSIYATPLITDLHADGRKDIIVPSFVHYLEVLEGPNGGQAVGWPAFHSSSVHASPLLYDIDSDGVRDILVATYDGQIVFYKDTGEKMREGIMISRLRVRKGWYEGLDPKDPFDHSHPDVGDGANSTGSGAGKGSLRSKSASNATTTTSSTVLHPSPTTVIVNGGNVAGTQGMEDRVRKFVKQITEYRAKYGNEAADNLMEEAHATNAIFYEAVMRALGDTGASTQGNVGGGSRRRLMSFGGEEDGGADGSGLGGRRRHLLADGDAAAGAGAGGAANGGASGGDGGAAGGADASAGTGVGGAGSGAGAGQPQGDVREEGPRIAVGDPVISDEAAESFGIFEEAVGGGDALPYTTGDGEIDQYLYQAQDLGELDGDIDRDGLFGGGDGDDGAASTGDLDDFLERLQYDEFGDLQSTHELGREEFERDEEWQREMEHGHRIDPNAVDADELSRDAYQHLYFGDYAERDAVRMRMEAEALKERGVPHDDIVKQLRTEFYGRGWREEDFVQASHPSTEGEFVWVDPHIMTTPAIADIDGDGHDELVVAVSYFYDREYYDDPDHSADLKGIDIGKYVASGVAVFDLRTRSEKWVQHLDLSVDSTEYKAYAYSSPTLVDLNGDGKLEIVVGTSMGFLYVLDARGTPLPGWPIQMGEIQGQPLVADINNDGELEVVAADMRGNIAAFTSRGAEVWERHVHSAVSQGAVAGDVDGDGQLEVVVGSASGYVYALAGSTGADIPNWPYRARGRVQAQATLSHLVEGPGLQVIVPAFDGFLYVIDGLQACADVEDLGETSYSAVLVEDVDGDGLLELVAATMNGNVYALETGAPYHPLATWAGQVVGPNGQVARWGYAGVAATPASRQARDVAGERLQVQFEIVDKRVAFADNGTLIPGGRGPYNVSIVLKGVGVKEMAAGDAPVVGVADSFSGPGKYTVDIPCPRSQASAVVRIEMVDSSGLQYADEFALSFHMHYHRLLKWAVAGPLGLMLAVLLAVTRPRAGDRAAGGGGGAMEAAAHHRQ